MAVLKKIRSRLWSQGEDAASYDAVVPSSFVQARYDVRPMTISQLDECWRLDQRCFVDGEAYSRDTFEYLLMAAECVSYRAVTPNGMMVGFELVEGAKLEGAIDRLLAEPRTAYLHLHYAAPGCYAARVERA